MCRYCFRESFGCVDGIPGRKDGQYVVGLRDQVLMRVYQFNGGGLGSLSGGFAGGVFRRLRGSGLTRIFADLLPETLVKTL